MTDAKFIVDRLNAEPFNYELTMVSLSEKDPTALLQLLSDVFAHIADHQATDVRAEGPENTNARLMEFLRIIKYKIPGDQLEFRQGMAEGSPDFIYPILKWVLPQLEPLKKRAFVGYYLSKMPLPDELVHDEDTQELLAAITDLQAEFINVHKEVEAMRADAKDPHELGRKNKLLEEEKEQLAAKIQSTKMKVNSKVSGQELQELQALSTALRKQQEEELDLQQTLRKEQERLEGAERTYNLKSARMREMRASAVDGSSATLLSQLLEETNQNRVKFSDKIPAEIKKKHERMMTIQKVLAEPVNSEQDLARLNQQRERLDGDVKVLQEKISEKNPYGDKADLQVRQQANIAKQVAKKREDVMYKLEKLNDKRANMLRELSTMEGGSGMDTGGGLVQGEDWKVKFESVKQKMSTYKMLKRELDEIQNEVLSEKEKVVSQQVGVLEKKKGVSGFIETAESLEKVSAAKGEIDEAKGQTLEEISKFVTEINQVIKERKSKLAPQIKDLRAVRQKFQELEVDHGEKKKTYDQAAMSHESKHTKLTTEVRELQTNASADEGKYHWLNCMNTIVDVSVKRVTAGLDSQALRDRYTKKVVQQEELSKSLKGKQKTVKDKSEPNKNQMGMLRDLKRLLEVKVACHRKGNVGQMLGGVADNAKEITTAAGANVMVL